MLTYWPHTFQKPSCFVGQVANLRPTVNRPLVGQPILAAAGFQPALFVLRFVGFCRKRRSRQGSSVARVNAPSPESAPSAAGLAAE
jgi:hypothetical protein